MGAPHHEILFFHLYFSRKSAKHNRKSLIPEVTVVLFEISIGLNKLSKGEIRCNGMTL